MRAKFGITDREHHHTTHQLMATGRSEMLRKNQERARKNRQRKLRNLKP